MTHIIINHSLSHLPPPLPENEEKIHPNPFPLPFPHMPDLSRRKLQFTLNNATKQYIITGATKLKHNK
jgi:hypothetical protein